MKDSSLNMNMGNVYIDTNVIAEYAGQIASECIGVVGMAHVSMKDGIVSLLKKNDATKGIQVTRVNQKLDIDLHIVVAYGVNIMTVVSNLMDSVFFKVNEFTGMEIGKVNIFVEGVRAID